MSARPTLGPPPALIVPATEDATLPSGLRVLVVRRPAVPLVELRLHVPFALGERSLAPVADLLGETLFTGTARRDRFALAETVQGLGGALSAGVDADRLVISGSALATALPQLLELLAEVLASASYPDTEVAGERERIGADLAIAWSQPTSLARESLLARLYGEHPYASELPRPEALAAVGVEAVRDLHARRVGPAGSVLVLVGDLDPAEATTVAARALAGWMLPSDDTPVPAPPPIAAGPLQLVDRPGAVQTNIRMGGPALTRSEAGYPALQLAGIIFGGYFSSRLVANIREDKGYTYSPRAGIEHARAGSRFTVAADVATEVTAPALLEIDYELGRMATTRVTDAELEAARQYASGTLALSTATQAGLASTLSALAGVGLGADWLRGHPLALAEVGPQDVLAAAQRFLAPTGLAPVLLGDRAEIAGAVARLRPTA